MPNVERAAGGTTDAVILAPTTSARNVIQAGGNFPPLVIKGFASWTSPYKLIQFQDSGGSNKGAFSGIGMHTDSSGTLQILNDAGTSTLATFGLSDPQFQIPIRAADRRGLRVTGFTAQTAALTVWEDSAAVLKASVSAAGKLYTASHIEIDGDLDHDGSNVGFYGTAPIAKQTGVAVTAEGVHAALVNLGLIAA